jgi:hypothetical protein
LLTDIKNKKLETMKKLIIFFSAAILVTGVGCEKGYLDINTNPNSPADASPELVLPTALRATAARQITGYTFINGWMGYWAISGSYAISNNDFTTYQQTNTFGNGLWFSIYDNLEDYQYVETQGRLRGEPFFEAAGKIMKAYEFQQLVDMFGNVPYTDALQGTSVILPTYTDAQDIYDSLEYNLGVAIDLIKTSPDIARSGDILFGGDNTSWIKLANTLRLRILLRQSQIGRDSYIQGEIAKITAEGTGFLDVDAAADPGFLNADGKQNPFWDFNYNTSGTYTQDFWRANQYSITFYKNNDDPRLEQVYRPASSNGEYQGNYIGQPSGAFVGSASSTFGPGVLKSFAQPAVILPASESYFMQAEAALRGWIQDDPQALYEAGVTASFEFLGVPDADAAAEEYYTQAGNKQTNYAATTNFNEHLAVIIRQKWASENTVTPFEAWADYRRLHLPADIPITQSPYVDVPEIPVRIIYPEIEYQTNAANVTAQGTVNHHTTKIFWMP